MRTTTNRAEPGDIETLNIETKFTHDSNHQEKVMIAVVPTQPEVVSLVIAHLDSKYKSSVIQACLSLEEIEMMIDGLTLAKLRMEILQMQDGPEKTLMAEVTKEWSIDAWDTVQSSVGDLHYDVKEFLDATGVDRDCNLSTEANLLEAKSYFEEYMGW